MRAEQASWDAVSLRSLCLDTTTIDPTKTPGKVFEYVDVSAVSNELWKIVSSTHHTGATAPGRARKLVRAQDVIFATVRPSLKRIALVPQNLDEQVVSTAFCVLRADLTKADPLFIYYSLLTEDFVNQVSNLERGASYPAVTDKDILEQEIVVPPLPEQRAIAAVLSKIQAAVEVQEKIVATLKELKAATTAKLFREGVVRGFMFDTHIFDKILDGQIDLSQPGVGHRLFITHVQRDEIERCKDQRRREELLRIFESVPQIVVPTESGVFGVSRFGGAKFSDDSSILEAIRKGNPKHTEDALIAETCIKQNLVLVTEEKDLPKWVRKAGGEAIRFEDFVTRRWRSLKQTGIGEIPESWEVVRLGEVASVERGKFAHRPRNAPQFYGGRIPFIQTGDVAKCNGRIRTYTQTLNEDGLAISRLFPKGTIVLTIAANIGDTGILEFDSAFPDSLVGITPEDTMDVVFLEYYLRTQKPEMDRLAPKGTQKNINIQFLKPWPTPRPSLQEQREIAHHLRNLDEKLETASQKSSSLKSLFSSMLHLLMTGQVRVNHLKIHTTHATATHEERLG